MLSEQLSFIEDHEAFIFELDDVIYPEKDYLLQVYYLFAQFIEYAELKNAEEILMFMREVYEEEGPAFVFSKTADQFNLPERYQVNFDLLHQNVRLPLKLLLFEPILDLMKQITSFGKQLFLLTEGDPLKQLNKIKQTEWQDIATRLTVYFAEELSAGSIEESLNIIVNKHTLNPAKTVFIVKSTGDGSLVFNNGINLRSVDKLLAL